MNKMKILIIIGIILSAWITMPIALKAADNIPETPIDLILDLEAELQLSDSQISALINENKEIICKINQVRRTVEAGNKDICGYTSKRSCGLAPVDNASNDEYYKSLAKIKSLELEAIVKARTILTVDQLVILDSQSVPSKSLVLRPDCISQ